MNKRSHISFALVIALLALPLAAFAESGHNNVVWTKNQSSRTGLYTTKNNFITQGVSFNVSALYFYGDLGKMGGFNVNNLSGGVGIHYNHPVSNHVNLRFGLNAGLVRANNTENTIPTDTTRYDIRKFHSWYIQPSFGVLYYPFSNAGFYLTGGVAVTASIIENFSYWQPMLVEGANQKQMVEITNGGKMTYGILPMVQLGIGYTWALTPSWALSAELMVQQGLVHKKFLNLDAWPLDASQNDKGIDVGSEYGAYTDDNGVSHVRWNDGWVQLGLTVTYQWRYCERCRRINNYDGIRGRRR